jgi:enoyl-[acyl-carrier protein] reductase I
MDATATIENRIYGEIRIGDTASLTRTLSRDDIALFAAVSGDVNPAHLDPAFAATDMFHHVIAHGMWSSGLVSAVLGTQLPGPGTIYLGQTLRFSRPVAPGDTITAAVTVTAKQDKHRAVTLDCRCTNQNGEIVLSGEAQVMAPTEKVILPRVALPDVRIVHHDAHDTEAAAATAPLADLAGKRGLIVGIANAHSIATGCARAFRDRGARLAVTYLNETARPFVEPIAHELGAEWTAPCDVRVAGETAALFRRVAAEWGGLDFLLHSIAFAPKDDLHGRVVDSSAEGFALAMSVSCHSFVEMARLAEPLMRDGGCLLTVTFYGSERVVANYSLMGPVKAALESATRYIAAELGPKGIRAHAISPGPIATRAARGIDQFDALLSRTAATVPEGHLVDTADVGALAAFLVSDAARRITGTIIPVDGGQHLLA